MTLVFFLPRGKDRRERKAFNFQRVAKGTALKKFVERERGSQQTDGNWCELATPISFTLKFHHIYEKFSSRIYHSGKDGLLGELWAWTSVGLFCRALLPPSACSDIVDRVQHLSTCARILPQAHTHSRTHKSTTAYTRQARKHACISAHTHVDIHANTCRKRVR